MSYNIPSDTKRILTEQRVGECDNFSLIFHRYVPDEVIQDSKLQNEWLKQAIKHFSLDRKNERARKFQDLQTAIYRRWEIRTQKATTFELALSSRLIVGLGDKGSLEIGLTVDQTTGLPYIPGSALKGLTRSYTLYFLAEKRGLQLSGEISDSKKLDDFESEILSGKYDKHDAFRFYKKIFGTQDAAGQAIFHDAVLMGAPGDIYSMDVMTPHFPKWYENQRKKADKAPHDADSPNPVVFVTVNADCQFAFAVGWRGDSNPEAHQFARELLENALQDFGIGSKTAAGYGTFKPVK